MGSLLPRLVFGKKNTGNDWNKVFLPLGSWKGMEKKGGCQIVSFWSSFGDQLISHALDSSAHRLLAALDFDMGHAKTRFPPQLNDGHISHW